MSAGQLILILTAFLVSGGFMALIVLRAVRDRTETVDTAARVLILAGAFAVVSILALEQVLPRLEQALF